MFKKIIEIPELVIIGIGNLFYDVVLFIYQSIIFGFKMWWWKFHFYLFIEYLFGYHWIARRDGKLQNYDPENFIYGETPCITVKMMLRELDINPGDIFIDLGCGRGLPVFYARFLFGLKSVGYDLLPTFIDKAKWMSFLLRMENIDFICGDSLKADLSDARVIYAATTAYPGNFRALLIEKLREAPPGSYIITLSYPLPEKYFNLYKQEKLFFSWGKADVYYHLRRND
jgi:hypothetical protein